MSKYLTAFRKLIVLMMFLIPAFAVNALEGVPSMRYADQKTWQGLLNYLPAQYSLSNKKNLPLETSWVFNGDEIHLDRYVNDTAKAKILIIHGIGQNGRLMSMIAGAPLAQKGYDVVMPDLPGFGLSQLGMDSKITYQSWLSMLDTLVQNEKQHDNRPIYVLGIGSGGMLAYHLASINDNISGIFANAFIDTSNAAVRRHIAQSVWRGFIEQPFAKLLGSSKLGQISLSSAVLIDRYEQINQKNMAKIVRQDPLSANTRISSRFIESYLNYNAGLPPEQFTKCPVWLLQGEKDKFFPASYNDKFLTRLTQTATHKVALTQASHIPVEAAAIEDLVNTIDSAIQAK